MDCSPPGSSAHGDSPGKNTRVDCHALLQGIFPTQELNQGFLHCRQILYQLCHKGSPRILDWVACLFSSRSSQPRNWTEVSCIAGRFFTSWAMRDAKEWSNPNHFLELLYATAPSLIAQLVKNPPAMQKTWVQFLVWEDPLEKEIATHSHIFAREIPWTEEPGGR